MCDLSFGFRASVMTSLLSTDASAHRQQRSRVKTYLLRTLDAAPTRVFSVTLPNYTLDGESK